MSDFKIGGLTVYPSKATVSYQDLDGESERNADGFLVRQVIRRNVVKVELEFPPMTTDEIKPILAALNSPEFSFTYPDPLTGTTNTITAYCGDRQLGYLRTSYSRKRVNGKIATVSVDLYDGLRVSIIEY